MEYKNLQVSHICLKRDTEDVWLRVNPILLKGEIAVVEFHDCVKVKIGDGVKHFRDLEYLTDPKIKSLEEEIKELRQDLSLFIIVTNILIIVLAILAVL